jgi:uncharacterized lipoprotein YmbA
MNLAARLAILLVATCTSCASPPERLYILEPLYSEPRASALRLSIVEVRSLGIPELYDKPQIMVLDGPFRVRENEQERWAVPLKVALPRLFTAELNQKALHRRFVMTSHLMPRSPTERLDIEFSRLTLSASEGAGVQIRWIYSGQLTGKILAEGNISSLAKAIRPGYPGYVEALSRAALDAADQLGAKLTMLDEADEN